MIKLKLNNHFPHPDKDLDKVSGTILRLETDSYGIIKNRFWRNRLRDSYIDNCVEVIPEVLVSSVDTKPKINKIQEKLND